MSNDDILADLDAVVAIGRRWGDEIRAYRERVSRLEALLREEEGRNRQLLATNLRLSAEVDARGVAADAAKEYADSLI